MGYTTHSAISQSKLIEIEKIDLEKQAIRGYPKGGRVRYIHEK